jgi:hypothetical protein
MKIDGCFVINLDHRTDRWQQFETYRDVFERLPVAPERRSAVLGKSLPGYRAKPWFRKGLKEERARAWAGKAGCTLSHVQAIREACARGWKTVLVLEDDVVPSASIAAVWSAVSAWLDTLEPDWAAVYLYGHHPQSPGCLRLESPAGRIYEISGAFSTTAYLLNLDVCAALLQQLPADEAIWHWTARHKTIDRWLAHHLMLLGRVYACVPSAFLHAVTASDATTAAQAYEAPPFALEEMPDLPAGRFECARRLRRLSNRTLSALTALRYLVKRFRGL